MFLDDTLTGPTVPCCKHQVEILRVLGRDFSHGGIPKEASERDW